MELQSLFFIYLFCPLTLIEIIRGIVFLAKAEQFIAKKINDFWKDKYEIAYKTKLGIYGDEHERSFYRVLRVEYDDIFSDAYSSDTYSRALREQLRRINRELLNTERTVRL